MVHPAVIEGIMGGQPCGFSARAQHLCISMSATKRMMGKMGNCTEGLGPSQIFYIRFQFLTPLKDKKAPVMTIVGDLACSETLGCRDFT